MESPSPNSEPRPFDAEPITVQLVLTLMYRVVHSATQRGGRARAPRHTLRKVAEGIGR
jgi:hypothetical protein